MLFLLHFLVSLCTKGRGIVNDKTKSTLENALKEAIEEIETEKKEIAAQNQATQKLKILIGRFQTYRVAINHAKVGKNRLLQSD